MDIQLYSIIRTLTIRGMRDIVGDLLKYCSNANVTLDYTRVRCGLLKVSHNVLSEKFFIDFIRLSNEFPEKFFPIIYDVLQFTSNI